MITRGRRDGRNQGEEHFDGGVLARGSSLRRGSQINFLARMAPFSGHRHHLGGHCDFAQSKKCSTEKCFITAGLGVCVNNPRYRKNQRISRSWWVKAHAWHAPAEAEHAVLTALVRP